MLTEEKVLGIIFDNPTFDPTNLPKDKMHLFDTFIKYSKNQRMLLECDLLKSTRFDWYTLESSSIPSELKEQIFMYLNSHEEAIKKKWVGLYLWSDSPWSGKTTIMKFIMRELFMKWYSIYFESLITIKNKWKDEFDKEVGIPVSKKLKNVDILWIDDIGSEKISDWLLEQLKDIIDDRYNNKKTLMLTSNYSIDSLPLSPKLRDRIKWLCYPIRFPEKSFRIFWK